MNNTNKIGHVIKDDHIKKVKKLFKKKLIKCDVYKTNQMAGSISAIILWILLVIQMVSLFTG